MVVRKLATMLLTLGLFVVSLTAAAEVGSVGAFGVTTEDLLSAGVPFVSPGAVDAAGIDLGFTRGALIRDPDGHAVQLVEEARR